MCINFFRRSHRIYRLVFQAAYPVLFFFFLKLLHLRRLYYLSRSAQSALIWTLSLKVPTLWHQCYELALRSTFSTFTGSINTHRIALNRYLESILSKSFLSPVCFLYYTNTCRQLSATNAHKNLDQSIRIKKVGGYL